MNQSRSNFFKEKKLTESITASFASHDECLLLRLCGIWTNLCKAKVRDLEYARVINQQICRLFRKATVRMRLEKSMQEK